MECTRNSVLESSLGAHGPPNIKLSACTHTATKPEPPPMLLQEHLHATRIVHASRVRPPPPYGGGGGSFKSGPPGVMKCPILCRAAYVGLIGAVGTEKKMGLIFGPLSLVPLAGYTIWGGGSPPPYGGGGASHLKKGGPHPGIHAYAHLMGELVCEVSACMSQACMRVVNVTRLQQSSCTSRKLQSTAGGQLAWQASLSNAW